jgi:hypothetical protein
LLRGAIGQLFADDPLFHQHDRDGLRYRYPKIHYRWDQQGPFLVAFGEGAEAAIRQPWPGMELRLGDRSITVLEIQSSLIRHVVQPTDRLVRYTFGAPWIPFDQDNYRRYQALQAQDKAQECDRLAVAGILMALRGLEIEVSQRVYAAFEFRKSQPCKYKAIQLIGLRGSLVVNLDLPDGLAIGRAVSHGYGWLMRRR